jgi:hypothetical protein
LAIVGHAGGNGTDDIIPKSNNMSDNTDSKKWTDLFCRAADREDGTPRFSLKGAKSYLYEYAGYPGGHAELDGIIELLKSIGIKCHVSGADSPMNVRDTEYIYHFEDGGFEIYSGNYFFDYEPPGHGAFVVGFKAFRWLLNQLGIKQPRRFKNELSTNFTATTIPCVQNGVDKTPGSGGIDNWSLHKLLAGYRANEEKETQS